eukprot:CAMPEP_0204044334 /NCGR_PEP_ID=MMETSP0360-20130528/104712_1 /ASSEMBLY_ACC=CAM_ASM_000342 /TAXON_ID=268821 /ORGANISM="Scrippsiella Hangoei, Strain SHTV-5" /LENGTH=63 /DNA_ID=CAMNT_0050990787 /DNA_START=25 /DNA_END=213 /DNA_ORIENTATION=+
MDGVRPMLGRRRGPLPESTRNAEVNLATASALSPARTRGCRRDDSGTGTNRASARPPLRGGPP